MRFMTALTLIHSQKEFLHCDLYDSFKRGVFVNYFIAFLLLAAIPATLQILFGLSSYTQGFAINSLIILLVLLVSKRFSRYLSVILNQIKSKSYIILCSVVLLHFGIIIFRWFVGQPVDFLKFIVGLTMGVGLGLQAAYLSYIVIRIADKDEAIAVNMFVITYLLFGILGLFGYTIFGSFESRKPIFFYSEISHYAIGLAPLYCVWSVLTKRFYVRWSGHLIIFLIGFLYQSTTLLIVVVSVIFVTSKPKVSFAIIGLSFCALFYGGNDLVYYKNRLSLNYNEDVVENMAYLQGWQEAGLNLYNSNGFGVGLQQFGIMEPTGDIAQASAMRTEGSFINRFEGGFGAAKILGEFGLLGVVFIYYLIVQIVRAAGKIRKLSAIAMLNSRHLIDIYAYSFLYVFFVYLFVRGGGYFGPNYVYLIAGLILLYLPRSKV